MDTALYFPYVRVPQTPWFTQVLLYWDRVASIVPDSLRAKPDALDPYMRELKRERLLEYVRPDSELWETAETFTSAFLKLLEGLPIPPEGERRFTRLHISKLPGHLFDELHSRGLAKDRGGNVVASWHQVEVTTADAYMAYLACVISGKRKETTLPVTDHEQAIGTLAGAPGDLDYELAQLRYAVITQALPAPSGPVPATELRKFKGRNSDKLIRCRKYLDGKLADLAGMPAELRKVKADAIMQELEDDVKSLQEQMNKARWPGVDLVGFGGVMGVALETAATVAHGGGALALGLGVGAGALLAGREAYAAAELIKRPRYNPRAPLAYAALAGRL
jgi:hypothetical protein